MSIRRRGERWFVDFYTASLTAKSSAGSVLHIATQPPTNERRRGHELGTAYRHPSTVASNTASHPCLTRLSLANAITSP